MFPISTVNAIIAENGAASVQLFITNEDPQKPRGINDKIEKKKELSERRLKI